MLNKLNKRRGAFTLVEIMIVVAIIALLAAIAVPGFLRARKRSQAAKILNDLRLIDSAVDQYAIETNKKSGDAVAVTDEVSLTPWPETVLAVPTLAVSITPTDPVALTIQDLKTAFSRSEKF